ncbi:MAG: internal scaffolding protein [Microvirus sp.]|nr:MAG: internal scaffolding protein [Microvirus sp.]
MNYQKNRIKARTVNHQPTLTDQAGARDTDINVIVKQFLVHGQMPGTTKQPIPDADFTRLPTDLRGFIDLGRSIQDNKAKLPPSLQGMSTDKLLALTPEELKIILAPPETEKPKEEPK